ncbi:nucleotide exchange factor GrpE [Bacillus sp. P14.5]|uniref:nucleotide exchange factor GrpE n=1 Tax=Bacillus sp. P14.5 TaxID=1983400 RepID=UPI000DEBC29A|nr:nucleotide exchange factor GrpE [Bacillus sp. P14.5]
MAEETNNKVDQDLNDQQEGKNSEGVEEEIFAESLEGQEGEGTGQSPEETQIIELQSKLDESESRYLRLRADFDNFRRRANLDREANEKYKAQSIVTELLPAIDNFERALNVEPDNEQTKSLLQGMEMVYRSLVEALKKEGVEPIETVGQEFDPHLHQAVMQGEDENFGSNIVTEEFQKGYKLKDRIIRPSMVKVNQ